MTRSNISPFEPERLRVSPPRPPALPELPREGEDPADRSSYASRDEGIWINDHWRLSKVPGVGVPLVLMLHRRDHNDLADLPDDLAS